MKNKSYITILLSVIILTAVSLYADENGSPRLEEPGESFSHNASFGLSGNFRLYDTYSRKGSFDTNPTYGYGGHFVFEKMFNNMLGVHSGLGYAQTALTVIEQDMEMDWTIRMISFPVMLITSINSGRVSLNLLTGFEFCHMITSEVENPMPAAEVKTADVLPFVTANPIMAAAGINLKIRVGSFTDFFIGGTGSISLNNIMKEDNKDTVHLYSYGAVCGILFRTDLFPSSR